LIDFTPDSSRSQTTREEIQDGPLFTPPVVSTWNGPLGTLMLPGTLGGSNWQGGSLRSVTTFSIFYSSTEAGAIGLIHDSAALRHGFHSGGRTNRDPNGARGPTLNAALTVQGLPIIKPPYGRITASI